MRDLAVGLLLLCSCDRLFGLEPVDVGQVRKLMFDNTESGTDLIDVPVLVVLDQTVVDRDALAKAITTLAFHDPDTNRDLPFEIDHVDPDGQIAVWVLVPQIDRGSATDSITMTIGGSDSAVRATDVWSGQFELVTHLEPDHVVDSTGAGHTGVLSGPTFASGQIGSGIELAGAPAQQVTFSTSDALFDRWDRFTLELWVHPSYAAPTDLVGEGRILGKGGALGPSRVFLDGASQLQLQFDFAFEAGLTYLGTQVPTQAWSYIAYSYDGQRLSLYKDGTSAGTQELAAAGPLKSSSGPLYLGADSTPLKGSLDEVRVSRLDRSPDWIRAQYRAMARQFVTFTAP